MSAFDPRYDIIGDFAPPIKKMGRMGNGRYLYRIASGAQTTIQVVDLSLITAANYAGAGSWTANPLSSITGLVSRTTPAIEYNGDKMVVTRHQSGGGNIEVVDANPNSGTFNTLLTSFTPTGLGNQATAIYNPFIKCYVIIGGDTIYFWKYGHPAILGTSSTMPNFDGTDCVVNPFNGDMVWQSSSNFFQYWRFVGWNKGRPVFKVIFGSKFNASILQFMENRPDLMLLCRGTGGGADFTTCRVPNPFDKQNLDLDPLASVTTNHTIISRNGSYNQRYRQLYLVNNLVAKQYDCSNPLAITAGTQHTRTAIGTETTAVSSLVSQVYDLFLFQANGTGNCLHCYDVSNGGLTYIGYVNFGNANVSNKYCILNKFSQL